MTARHRRATPGIRDRRHDAVRPQSPPPGPVSAPHRLALAVLIAAYAVTFSILCWIRWRHYLYTDFDLPYPMPQGVAVVIADLAAANVIGSIGPGSTERIRAVLAANQLVPVAASGDLVRFERAPRETLALVAEGGCDRPAPPIVFDGQLAWRGGGLLDSTGAPGGSVRLQTCWERIGTSDRFHGIELWLVDAAGRVRQTRRRELGYVVWPPLSWPAGVPHREDYRMLLDDDLAPGDYTVRMRVIWRGINISGESTSDAPDRSPPGIGIVLGRLNVTTPAR